MATEEEKVRAVEEVDWALKAAMVAYPGGPEANAYRFAALLLSRLPSPSAWTKSRLTHAPDRTDPGTVKVYMEAGTVTAEGLSRSEVDRVIAALE